MRSKMHIVLEAMDYNYLMDVQPPNIMKYLDPHPAVTWGLGSRPSTGAYTGGMLPVCQIPNCYHRQIGINWCNPFFMHLMKEYMKRRFLLCSNGWSLELLIPWMESLGQIQANLKWIEMRKETEVAKEMVDYFLADREDPFYAYFHFFETHYPFHAPGYPRDGTARKEALLYVDEQIGRILEDCIDDVDIVMCSDHNLPPQIVSAAFDVPAPRTMLSFIATNFKEIEKTYPGDHLKWMQEKYGVTTENK
jgi:hypothetical protein